MQGWEGEAVIVVGAGGHAVEVLDLLRRAGRTGDLHFFDGVNRSSGGDFHGFPVLRTEEEVRARLAGDPRFLLGLGGPEARRRFLLRWEELGGEAQELVADTARLGAYGVERGRGVTLMDGSWVSSRVVLGDGVLLNQGAAVHHDARVGAFSEVGPGARLLGRASLGEGATLGAAVVILPGVRVGKGAVVGAGAVVVEDVPPGETRAGVPARPLRGGA